MKKQAGGSCSSDKVTSTANAGGVAQGQIMSDLFNLQSMPDPTMAGGKTQKKRTNKKNKKSSKKTKRNKRSMRKLNKKRSKTKKRNSLKLKKSMKGGENININEAELQKMLDSLNIEGGADNANGKMNGVNMNNRNNQEGGGFLNLAGCGPVNYPNAGRAHVAPFGGTSCPGPEWYANPPNLGSAGSGMNTEGGNIAYPF